MHSYNYHRKEQELEEASASAAGGGHHQHHHPGQHGGSRSSSFVDRDKITRNEAIEALLTDPALADVQFRGKDGVIVFANRGMLAARSRVFRRMLFGNFQESNMNTAQSKILDVGYKGDVMTIIFEFVCKEDADIFHMVEPRKNKKNKKDEVPPTDSDDAEDKKNGEIKNETVVSDNDTTAIDILVENKADFIDTILGVVAAAHYYAIPELSYKARELAKYILENDRKLVCCFLTGCEHYGLEIDDIHDIALQIVRDEPHLLLNDQSGWLGLLSFNQMDRILQGQMFTVGREEDRFELLRSWCLSGSDYNNSTSPSDVRRNQAFALSKHIQMDLIRPAVLTTKVASSGFVSFERLADAYKVQALRAERYKSHPIDFESFRLPVWHSTGSSDLTSDSDDFNMDLIRCKEMKTGIHTWKVLVRELGEGSVFLGLSSIFSIFWYRHDGVFLVNKDEHKQKLPSFTTNSLVTFVLDLTKAGGIISVKVDGGDMVELYGNMISVLQSEADSFVPRAALRSKGASLSFLGFEQRDEEQDEEKSLELMIAETLKANLQVTIAAAANPNNSISRIGK